MRGRISKWGSPRTNLKWLACFHSTMNEIHFPNEQKIKRGDQMERPWGRLEKPHASTKGRNFQKRGIRHESKGIHVRYGWKKRMSKLESGWLCEAWSLSEYVGWRKEVCERTAGRNRGPQLKTEQVSKTREDGDVERGPRIYLNESQLIRKIYPFFNLGKAWG